MDTPIKIDKNLIDLQKAYTTQVTTANEGKLDWVIYNEEQKELGKLPKDLNEDEMFAILDFAREYELIAFNIGINFMREKKNEEIRQLVAFGDAKLAALVTANNLLAMKLEKYIISEE